MENKKIVSNPNIQAIIRLFYSPPRVFVSKENKVVNSYIFNFDGEVSQKNEVIEADIQIESTSMGKPSCDK